MPTITVSYLDRATDDDLRNLDLWLVTTTERESITGARRIGRISTEECALAIAQTLTEEILKTPAAKHFTPSDIARLADRIMRTSFPVDTVRIARKE